MEAHNQCVTNIAEESINHQIFQYEKQFSIFYKKKKIRLGKEVLWGNNEREKSRNLYLGEWKVEIC